jgi:hypothetical protein
MAQINVQPLYLKDVILTVDGDTYEKHVSGVTITPSVATATFKGLEPSATFSQASTATWMLDLTFVQDWETEDSLSAYLFNNAGEEVTMSFKPESGSGGTFSATVIIVPGSVGGTVDAYATSTVSLPVQGQPSYTPAA